MKKYQLQSYFTLLSSDFGFYMHFLTLKSVMEMAHFIILPPPIRDNILQTIPFREEVENYSYTIDLETRNLSS